MIKSSIHYKLLMLGCLAILAGCSSGPTKSNDLLQPVQKPLSAADIKAVQDTKAVRIQDVSVELCKNPKAETMERINSCVRNESWNQVESLSLAWSKNDLSTPWPAYFLSLSAEARHDLARAQWMVELAQKKAHDKVAIFEFQHARVLWQLNQPEAALQEMKWVIENDAKMVDAMLFMASESEHEADSQEAERYFRLALKAEPKNNIAREGLVRSLQSEGKTEEAGNLQAAYKAEDQGPINSSKKVSRKPAQEGTVPK